MKRYTHGRDWSPRLVRGRVVYVAPDGVAYVEAREGVEPDAVIEWDKPGMPALRLVRFDLEQAEKREERRQRKAERRERARRERSGK